MTVKSDYQHLLLIIILLSIYQWYINIIYYTEIIYYMNNISIIILFAIYYWYQCDNSNSNKNLMNNPNKQKLSCP